METSVIDIMKMNKSFGPKQVLFDINLTINKGEIFGLIGPSGAGKTTLINILTGQLEYSNGKALIFDNPCNDIPKQIYSQIGMALDFPALFERLTSYQNLLIYSDIWGVNRRKIDEVLESVGLLESKSIRVFQLSKGMKQRLILARALLHEPKLLFLDEPTSALDPGNTNMIHDVIMNLQKKGVTIFLSSHKMNEIMKLCNNVALLNKGRIIEYGNPYELCRKYDSEKKYQIVLLDGSIIELSCDNNEINAITKHVKRGEIKEIKSSMPDLETVFMMLTQKGE